MRGLVVALGLLFAGSGFAGETERACLASERSPGPATCACAQQVADRTLSPRDQAQAAKIIADPDLFQIIAKDKNPAAKAFIERYRGWGEQAAKSCRRLR